MPTLLSCDYEPTIDSFVIDIDKNTGKEYSEIFLPFSWRYIYLICSFISVFSRGSDPWRSSSVSPFKNRRVFSLWMIFRMACSSPCPVSWNRYKMRKEYGTKARMSPNALSWKYMWRKRKKRLPIPSVTYWVLWQSCRLKHNQWRMALGAGRFLKNECKRLVILFRGYVHSRALAGWRRDGYMKSNLELGCGQSWACWSWQCGCKVQVYKGVHHRVAEEKRQPQV